MNNLPIDLIKDIFLLVCLDNPPLLSYRIKYVNQCFYQIVNDYKGGLSNIEDTNDDRYILYDYGNIDIYRWLYDNKQFLTYEDVLGLILFRRVDILKYSIRYNNNIDVIFNKFHISSKYENPKFNIFDLNNINSSILLYACECNNLDAIKFLLKYGYCYYSHLPNAIDVCCNNNNINIVKYLFTYYIHEMYSIKYSKLINCINVFGNKIEDLLFYLILSKKIAVTKRLKTTLLNDIDFFILNTYIDKL